MFVYVMAFLFLKKPFWTNWEKKDTQQEPFIRFYLKDAHEKLLIEKLQPINFLKIPINWSYWITSKSYIAQAGGYQIQILKSHKEREGIYLRTGQLPSMHSREFATERK